MTSLFDSIAAVKDTLRMPSLAIRTEQLIEELILDGKLKPGMRLVEEEFSEALGVSRTSLREAMINLEQAGILERDRRGGRYIREMTATEIRDLYEGWSIIESEAASLACMVAGPQDHKRLQDLVGDMDRAEDIAGYHRLNLEFHWALVMPCQNRWLKGIYEGCLKQIRFAWAMTVARAGDPESSQIEHRLILEAYKARDQERTRTVICQHLSAGAQRIVSDEARPPTDAVAGRYSRRRDSRRRS
jgi:DNA-binding GntR family transcriptional regulator